MRFSCLLPLSLLACGIDAATIEIDVGKNGFSFSPSTITAAVGDVLAFHFFGPTHTVVEGDFANPCVFKAGGFYSGQMQGSGSGEGPNLFLVTVTSTDPMAIFCRVPGHCQAGMVAVVNGAGSMTFSAYESGAASASSQSGPEPPVGGGQVVPSSESSTTTSATSMSSVTSASTSVSTSMPVSVSTSVSVSVSVSSVSTSTSASSTTQASKTVPSSTTSASTVPVSGSSRHYGLVEKGSLATTLIIVVVFGAAFAANI